MKKKNFLRTGGFPVKTILSVFLAFCICCAETTGASAASRADGSVDSIDSYGITATLKPGKGTASVDVCSGSSANTKKDVTSKYKKKVSKMLRTFDYFLAYDLCYNNYGHATKKFPFNDYTKTSMLAYTNTYWYYGESVSTVKSELADRMQLYFGDSKSSIKFKSISTQQYPYLFGKKYNKVYHLAGDYSGDYVYGKVSKITKKENRYYATYKVYIVADDGLTEIKHVKSGGTYLGTYKVKLKKASNKYGFIIKDIKRTKVAKA